MTLVQVLPLAELMEVQAVEVLIMTKLEVHKLKRVNLVIQELMVSEIMEELKPPEPELAVEEELELLVQMVLVTVELVELEKLTV